MRNLFMAICGLFMASTASAAEPIVLGTFLSLTGPASVMGEPEKQTLELYVNKINKSGGLLGRQIKLIIYDDASDAEKAASFTKRLIESDKADVILGGTITPPSMAAIPLVEKAEIPYMSFGGGIGITEPVKKWVFKTPHTDKMCAEKVFADMKKRGITKIALLSENIGFGKSGHDQSLKVAPQMGIEILADEIYAPKDSDVTPQLTKIRGISGVQALFIFGTGAGPAVATKNFHQMGFNIPLYQSHGVASRGFIKLVGDASEGVRLPVSGIALGSKLPDSDPQKKIVSEFQALYEDATKQEISSFAGHAYDGLHMVVAAIQRAGTTNKAKVRDEIEKTKNFIGTAGVVNMSPTDHLGLTLDAFYMVEIKKADWVSLK